LQRKLWGNQHAFFCILQKRMPMWWVMGMFSSVVVKSYLSLCSSLNI
jgi:hypothetical protein